jgi:hypothetical protein
LFEGAFHDFKPLPFRLLTIVFLARSGLKFLSLRAGVYTDAFPLYLNWYPSSEKVFFPITEPPVSEGRVAFTSRDELSEGIAALMAKGLDAFPSIKPKTDKNILLLTSQATSTLPDLARAISQARGTELPTEYLKADEWITESTRDDVGRKPNAWFEARLVVVEGFNRGDAEVVDDTLATLLGRAPENGFDGVLRLLKSDAGFTWHQNHM